MFCVCAPAFLSSRMKNEKRLFPNHRRNCHTIADFECVFVTCNTFGLHLFRFWILQCVVLKWISCLQFLFFYFFVKTKKIFDSLIGCIHVVLSRRWKGLIFNNHHNSKRKRKYKQCMLTMVYLMYGCHPRILRRLKIPRLKKKVSCHKCDLACNICNWIGYFTIKYSK